MRRMLRPLLLVTALVLLVAACGGDSDDGGDEAAASGDGSGIRLVSAEEGEAIRTDPPEGLVVLDVRTPEEFAEGHLEGAVMIDFYEADFADQIAELDPDVPYLLYCRSGNRSGQTAALMQELGFSDVADVDGGIIAWTDAGLPTITG
ncbi:MAG: rhodanese-like domain-containing protein [Actinomycetota bacterium]